MAELSRAMPAPTAVASSTLRPEGHLPIEAYAAIGDGRALALVGIDGAIDWMCLPQLDSPSVFGALLDPARGGRFEIRPAVPFTATRRYLQRTNVLETTFQTDGGEARLIDALTVDKSQTAPWRELVRQLEGVRGTVPMRWRCEPRFGYGQRPARFERLGAMLLARDHGLQLGVRSWDAGEPRLSAGIITGDIELRAGERSLLALLATHDEPLRVPQREAVERRLKDTAEVWRSWVSRHTSDGPWRDALERSLLTIKLLADTHTGAIAAAGTTSLPEVIGGDRNYDYRLGWVRDLCFPLDALLAVEIEEPPHASIRWLLRATRHTHPRIDPVYTLDGDVVRAQQQLPLPGYLHTGPVHVGNDAGSQLQLGGFGDLIETIAAYARDGHILPSAIGERLADIGNLLSRIWRSEDSGLWELGQRAQYGSSKLGCWVGFDRLLQLVDQGQVPARHASRWKLAREQARQFIESHLYSPQRRSYLFKVGGDQLDCALLLAARRGFGDRARVAAMIDAIRSELHAGGPLYYRYGGMQDEENAFLACSFWMIEAMASVGQTEAATDLMDAAVGLANDVGIYSEEMEPASRAMRGNFPQALTHPRADQRRPRDSEPLLSSSGSSPPTARCIFRRAGRSAAGELELREDCAQLALRPRRGNRGGGSLGGVVLAFGDPLAAGRPADRAHTRAVAIVDAAALIDGQLRLASKRLGHDLLDPRAVEALEPLIVHGGGDRGKCAVDFDLG